MQKTKDSENISHIAFYLLFFESKQQVRCLKQRKIKEAKNVCFDLKKKTYQRWKTHYSNEFCRKSSRTIAPEENCPPTPKLTLIQTLTLTGGHFSSYETVWLPPNPKTNPNLDPSPNANRRAIFVGGQLSGYPWLYHLACGINSKSSEMQSNIMPKNDNNKAKTVLLLFITVVPLLISLNSSNILLLMLVSWSLNR